MKEFKINKTILYATDINGVDVVNTKNDGNVHIKYPEATVWLVCSEGYEASKSIKILEAILAKTETETKVFIENCLRSWKNEGLIK